MKNNVLNLVITLTVVVICVAAIMMPVLNDATTTEKTLTNEGYFRMTDLSSSDTDTHTLAWSSTTGNILTVDGEELDITTFGMGGDQAVTIFACDTDLIRVATNSTVTTLSWIQIRGSTINYAGASSSFNATIGSGTVSFTVDSDTTTYSISYTDAYIIDPDGDYTMKNMNETAYMLEDSVIYAMGVTSVTTDTSTTQATVFNIDGTAESVGVTVVYSAGTSPTVSDIEINKTTNENYVGVYDFSSITFVATLGSTTTDCTYSYVIVPYQITAELSQHLDSGEIAIINAIPAMVIAALIIGAVGVFITSKRD